MWMYYARAAWGNNIVPDMQYTYHITIATQQMNTLNTCTSQMEILVFLEVSKKLSTKPLESSMALTLTGFSHKHVLSRCQNVSYTRYRMWMKVPFRSTSSSLSTIHFDRFVLCLSGAVAEFNSGASPLKSLDNIYEHEAERQLKAAQMELSLALLPSRWICNCYHHSAWFFFSFVI